VLRASTVAECKRSLGRRSFERDLKKLSLELSQTDQAQRDEQQAKLIATRQSARTTA